MPRLPEARPLVDRGQHFVVHAPRQTGKTTTLVALARACPRPLVLVFDEIDGLSGASLYSVLGQLRGGSGQRPAGFPHSVVLGGLRDVRDYRAASGADPSRMGGTSPFNIKVESLRLGDFTADEVAGCTPSTRPRPGSRSPTRRWRGRSTTRRVSRGWSTPWPTR